MDYYFGCFLLYYVLKQGPYMLEKTMCSTTMKYNCWSLIAWSLYHISNAFTIVFSCTHLDGCVHHVVETSKKSLLKNNTFK